MTRRLTREDLRAAVPALDGAVRIAGLDGPAEVWRDPEGIPHVRAGSVRDAFLAQGFVHAQDRLWQMEYDRRRALGRWAEIAGPPALAQDIQMRRFRLERSARADYEAASPATRTMLDAYAGGVNAFIATSPRLGVEFDLTGARPQPWRPWDAGLVYKVRHVMMGVWQTKAWRARLVRQVGAAMAARLCPGTPPNPMLIVPPGLAYEGPAIDGLDALLESEPVLTDLPEWEGGSNNWAVAGWRTASGRPLVAGDPHRPLDVPGVYYQNHLACPDFDVVGLSFAGVPGFPHFGHNHAVAWCVTHTAADYQDLYVERFAPGEPLRYEFRGAWREATTARERVEVRDAAPVEIEIVETHHGPVLLGDPRTGWGIAVRYTATAEPNRTLDGVRAMLGAGSAAELEAAMRDWVDPVNNLVFADVHGAIGYRTRGVVPVRARANAWVPVPGWDGAHEWQGAVPFDEMPAVRDPATGFVATANSRVAGADYPHHIGIDFAPDFRQRRLVARLEALRGATVADMAAIHADRVSIPGREFVEILRGLTPADGPSREALARLAEWDGAMGRESVAATIYALFRERLMRDLMTPILGPLAEEAFAGAPRGAVAHMARLRASLTGMIRRDDRTLLPAGADWPSALGRALQAAVAELARTLGPEPDGWRWGRLHGTVPRHTLSAALPALAPLLDPPALPVAGDGDTVQAGSFIAGGGYGLTSTSVARYVFDLGDWERSAWVVPLGASGHPGSPHYADQAETWGDVRLLPMRYGWERIRAEARHHQRLDPTPSG